MSNQHFKRFLGDWLTKFLGQHPQSFWLRIISKFSFHPLSGRMQKERGNGSQNRWSLSQNHPPCFSGILFLFCYGNWTLPWIAQFMRYSHSGVKIIITGTGVWVWPQFEEAEYCFGQTTSGRAPLRSSRFNHKCSAKMFGWVSDPGAWYNDYRDSRTLAVPSLIKAEDLSLCPLLVIWSKK